MASWRLRCTYLAYGPPDAPVALLCVLSLGFGRLRIGLVREGPVWLRELDEASTTVCLESLIEELRRRGFVLAGFGSTDADALTRIEGLAPSNRERLFPFPIAEAESLVVPQAASDEATASAFAPVARRDIRKAQGAGFTIEHADSAGALRAAWPIWMTVHRFRNQYGRSRASWLRLLEGGRALGVVRIYTASIGGRPVQSILVVQAGSRATYVIGALDREALGSLPSPSCLLHFRAMRDCFARGCTAYDLGSRSGPVHRFKSKFRPREEPHPAPVNLILEPAVYPLCRWLLARLR
ncbi:MAG TPA: GNAT family N-acetyltransferase [Thermoanaerobaculia bacterium]|nr:GNAT family N-acetyltransferase [Thermoanaerobaculia bacterium]